MIELTTDRLVIRTALPSDLGEFQRLMPEFTAAPVLDYAGTGFGSPKRKKLEASYFSGKDKKRFLFTIRHSKTKSILGAVWYRIETDTPRGKTAFTGFVFLPEYHAGGYAVEAFRAVIQYAFERGDIYILETRCFSDKTNALRVIQQSDMKPDFLHEESVFHEGRVKGQIHYRLRKDNWPHARGSLWQAVDLPPARKELAAQQTRVGRYTQQDAFPSALHDDDLTDPAASANDDMALWRHRKPELLDDSIIYTVDFLNPEDN